MITNWMSSYCLNIDLLSCDYYIISIFIFIYVTENEGTPSMIRPDLNQGWMKVDPPGLERSELIQPLLGDVVKLYDI